MASVQSRDPATQPFHVLLERKHCSQLFILYCGWAGRVVLPPMEFIQQAGILDRNILMLRDRMRTCYQRGVGGELPDIPSLIAWQRQQIESMQHVRRVYCIGSSGGGLMAMVSGHLLKAEHVWAFAPPVPLTDTEEVKWVDPVYSDLTQVLMQSNGVTRYQVYYNESHEPDRVGCTKLRDIPGVQLFSESGQGHHVIAHLARNKRLQGLLPPFEKA